MDALFGEIDYVEAGEHDTDANKVETEALEHRMEQIPEKSNVTVDHTEHA